LIAKLYIPKPPLNNFIESFFYYKGYNPEHSLDRYLPDANVTLIFDLTDKPKFIYDNDSLKEIQSCKNVWFSGFRTEPITIPSGKESEMLIINFLKGKSFSFLCEPLNNLTNYVVDAELVLKNDILNLRDEIQNAISVSDKFNILENNLLRHYIDDLKINPFVEFVIDKITSSPKLCSIKEIADKVGYSQKHLINIFKANVGVTPKEFLKVIRFQKAIVDIENQRKIDWITVANDCGFYDQSHFIADFKSFSGLTPVDYLKQKGDILNYVPIK